MKKYKVGDTIYTKGTVMQIDENDHEKPYGIKFVDWDYGTPAWPNRSAIIDELPTAEPVKPVLPKDVADEISFAKSIKGVTFDDYIVRELIRSDYKDSATNKMIQSSDIPNAIEVLSNAWYNGYTVEKEPTWCIEVPGKFNRPTYYAINNGALAFGYLDEDKKWPRDYSAHAFTDEEIKKYDLENFKKELVTNDDED